MSAAFDLLLDTFEADLEAAIASGGTGLVIDGDERALIIMGLIAIRPHLTDSERDTIKGLLPRLVES